jgi:ethanolamine utilization protein EutN
MIIGTVKGNIVSTIHHPFCSGKKLLVVEKEDFAGKPSGYLIAMDGGVDAGVGERVLVVDEGNSARQIVGDKDAPVRSIIVGVIDRVDVEA